MNPIIRDLPAFDKNKGTTGTFITSEQIYSHTVIIKDEKTNEELYQQSSELGNRLNRFTIPAFEDDTLKNGRSYRLYIKVFPENPDNNTNAISYTSAPKIIKCASTPDFQLNIYSEENTEYTLKSTTLNAGIKYIADKQDEKPELLNEYYVTVRNQADNKEIYRSGLIYDIDKTVEINDLEKGQSYIVAAHGKTVNGMEIETNDVTVNVNYDPCKDSSVLTTTNDKKNACIILNSHIDNILYRIANPPKYNPSLDLSENTLEYYDGFHIDDDFSMYLKYIPTAPNNAVLNLNNNQIKVNFKTKKQNRLYQPYFELYNGNKMIVIDHNESGQPLSHIDTGTYSFGNYYYELLLSRKNHRLNLTIRDWRR